MIISIVAGKAFDEIETLFMMKSLSKLDTKGNYLYLIKSICAKPTVKIIFHGERLHAFPLRLGTEQDVSSHYSYSTQSWKL